jgi:oxygen-independent coproporphyrinogen-3 oxidase
MRGLYIHIPFCKSKCKYCAFYSEIKYDNSLILSYLDSVLEDLKSYSNFNFDTIYVGGGTPSVIPVKILDSFLDNLLKIINFNFVEWTIEVNPESLNQDYLSLFKNYEINRISMGVQSTDDKVLKMLGRIHTFDDVVQSNKIIEKFYPDCNLNLDLIYDIPNVPQQIINKTLIDIVSFNPKHISAYSYSFDTGFLSEFDNDSDISGFDDVREILHKNKFLQYEVSNYAIQNFESRHNINYWQMEEYVGIGASAHSMLYKENNLRKRFSKTGDILSYMDNPYKKIEENFIQKDEMLKENFIFGLRMNKGIKLSNLEKEFDILLNKLLDKIKILIDEDFIEINGEYLCATKKGFLLLDSLSEFIWEQSI